MPLWYLKNNGMRICPPGCWSRSGLSGTRSNGIRPEMLCRNEVEVVDRPNPRLSLRTIGGRELLPETPMPQTMERPVNLS